jgi:O-antigen/teichoic acid export membrane protein
MVSWLGGQFGNTSRKGVWALVDQAVKSGSNFLTAVVIGRFCGLDQLGVYALAFALLVFLAVVQESLIWTPYIVYSPRLNRDDQPAYAGTALLIQALFTLAGMLLLAATGGVLSLGIGPPGLAPVVWVLVATAPFYLLREFVRRLLLARLDVATVLGIDILVAAIQLGGFVALYWSGILSAVTACAAVGASCLISTGLWFSLTKTRFQVNLSNLRRELGRHWSFGRWICASQLADAGHGYTLHWLLAVVVGTAATGVYAACSSIVLIFNPLIFGIGAVLVPRASQIYASGGHAELRRVVWKTTAFLGTSMSILCVGLAFFGDAALRFLYHGDGYAGYGLVITLLAVTTLVATLGFAAEHGMWVLERPDINFKIAACGLAVNLLVAVALVGTWGVLGAAIAQLCGMSLVSAAQCAVFVQFSAREPSPADGLQTTEVAK